MDAFMGLISAFGFNFAPKNWMTCAGQTIGISQNAALFSLLGTTYGGNGTTTFMLPNLNGRVAVGTGPLAGGSTYVLGQLAGTENVTLISSQMPQHSHALNANNSGAATTEGAPTNNFPGTYVDPNTGAGLTIYAPNPPNTTMNPQVIGTAGNSQAHPNMQPYLALTYCICVYGIFPSRN